jgi:hypothetical protein
MRRPEVSLTSSDDYLVRNIGAQVHTQREIEIMGTDSIAEFFGTFQLFLFEPFLEQVLAILCQYGSGEFKGFVTVQRAFIEENAKVLKNGRELTRLHRDMLESFDGVRRA